MIAFGALAESPVASARAGTNSAQTGIETRARVLLALGEGTPQEVPSLMYERPVKLRDSERSNEVTVRGGAQQRRADDDDAHVDERDSNFRDQHDNFFTVRIANLPERMDRRSDVSSAAALDDVDVRIRIDGENVEFVGANWREGDADTKFSDDGTLMVHIDRLWPRNELVLLFKCFQVRRASVDVLHAVDAHNFTVSPQTLPNSVFRANFFQ